MKECVISVKETIALIIFGIIVWIFSYCTRVLSGPKFWVVTGGWLLWFYIIIIFAFLAKMGIKIPNQSFFLLMVYLLMMGAGRDYVLWGGAECNLIDGITSTFGASMAMMNFPLGAREVLSGIVPKWLLLQDQQISNIYYFGGGVPENVPYWSTISPLILVYSLLIFGGMLAQHCFAFLFGDPRWYDIERLPFPYGAPLGYVINQTYPEKEGGKSGSLLSLKDDNSIS